MFGTLMMKNKADTWAQILPSPYSKQSFAVRLQTHLYPIVGLHLNPRGPRRKRVDTRTQPHLELEAGRQRVDPQVAGPIPDSQPPPVGRHPHAASLRRAAVARRLGPIRRPRRGLELRCRL